MTEAFIYYLWKYQLFNQPLIGTEGERISVIKTGTVNTDSGPDFFNSRLRIDDNIWAGNVEMHLRASDWNKHGHHDDSAYNNTILHVVYKCDKQVFTKEGRRLICLELIDKFDANLLRKYDYLLHNKHWIPCEKHLTDMPDFDWHHWLERMMIDRLESKSTFVEELLFTNKNDWEKAFFISIAGYFGQKINKLPFQILARSVDLRILAKHKDHLFQIEAILFGQAGMLDIIEEGDYQKDLKKEYDFLQKKYSLLSMPYSLWKYMRLRPAAFPDIRIAELALLIHQSEFLCSKMLELKTIDDLERLFVSQASVFWDTHYRFKVTSPKRPKKLGVATRNGIIINTVIPFLFVYGKRTAQAEYSDRALELLTQLKAEKNHISRRFSEIGKPSENALESQAQIQLKQNFCDYKKCLDCAVGLWLLRDQ